MGDSILGGLVHRLVSREDYPKMTPYEAGFECGKNGANTTNCHFSFFSSPERTVEWEKGKKDGERAKTDAAVQSPASPQEPNAGPQGGQ